MDRERYHLKKRIGINLIPVAVTVKPVPLKCMGNLCEHQLASVCLVVPSWLAVK